MMGAMFTSYNAVNNTYSQVTDRAKIKSDRKRCDWNDYERYKKCWI